jgi:hypothetical protein
LRPAVRFRAELDATVRDVVRRVAPAVDGRAVFFLAARVLDAE